MSSSVGVVGWPGGATNRSPLPQGCPRRTPGTVGVIFPRQAHVQAGRADLVPRPDGEHAPLEFSTFRAGFQKNPDLSLCWFLVPRKRCWW